MATIILNPTSAAPTVHPLGAAPAFAVVRDHDVLYKAIFALALVGMLGMFAWFALSKLLGHSNYEKCSGLCEEVVRHDRISAPDKVVDRSHELNKLRLQVDAKEAAATREQNAAIAAAALERQDVIVRPRVPAPLVVDSGCGVRCGNIVPRTTTGGPGCMPGFHPAPPPPGHRAWCAPDVVSARY